MIVKVSEIFVTKNVILKTIYTRYDFEFVVNFYQVSASERNLRYFQTSYLCCLL